MKLLCKGSSARWPALGMSLLFLCLSAGKTQCLDGLSGAAGRAVDALPGGTPAMGFAVPCSSQCKAALLPGKAESDKAVTAEPALPSTEGKG